MCDDEPDIELFNGLAVLYLYLDPANILGHYLLSWQDSHDIFRETYQRIDAISFISASSIRQLPEYTQESDRTGTVLLYHYATEVSLCSQRS